MTGSPLDLFFRFLVESEIPSLYFLIEQTFLALGAVIFVQCVIELKNVKQLTGIYSQMTFQLADVSPASIAAKFISSVFLMSYGAGQALIANSVFINSHFDKYSIEMFKSISCASGAVSGCLHYELGIYTDSSWQTQVINANFFNVWTSILMLAGAIAYGRGWIGVSRFNSQGVGGKPPPTLGGAALQIILGAMCMHPIELWELLT
ncbi:hypothetical protein [Vibrio sp. R78045]|uniref:hypothetical protein n=1 Tax=Vibrio sp. R78045 TaxID=3093868 RepID=UPI0036F2115A